MHSCRSTPLPAGPTQSTSPTCWGIRRGLLQSPGLHKCTPTTTGAAQAIAHPRALWVEQARASPWQCHTPASAPRHGTLHHFPKLIQEHLVFSFPLRCPPEGLTPQGAPGTDAAALCYADLAPESSAKLLSWPLSLLPTELY